MKKSSSKKPDGSSAKKKLLIGIGSFAPLAAISLAIYWAGSSVKEPPPPSYDVNTNLSYLASDNFSKQPDEKKLEYLQKMREKNISHRDMREKMRSLPEDERNKMRERMNKFFELKTQAEKDAYLDKIIDRMEQFRNRRAQARKENEQNGQQQNNAQRRRGRGFTPDRLKKRIENSDPQSRAQAAAFRAALRARMAQRRN
jgi:DNA-binding protein H-NS